MKKILYLTLISLFLLLSACAKQVSTPEKPIPPTVKRSSSAIAITADGNTLLTVNPDSDSITLISTSNHKVLKEISVGTDPRTVAATDDGKWAITANRESGTASIVDLSSEEVIAEIEIGSLPWGVIVDPDNHTAYVACEESDHIAVINIKKEKTVKTITVEDRPTGLAISQDGTTLYVTHLLSGKISKIDTNNMEVTNVINTWPNSNLSQSILIDHDNVRAYLPQTRSNDTNMALTFDTTVFPLITVVDLSTLALLPKKIISLPEVDTAVGLPYDAVLLSNAEILYVVNAASNDVSVIDLETNTALAHIEVGDNPRGIVASLDNKYVYVNNTLSGSVSIIDTEENQVIKQIRVTKIPLPPALLRGKRLFHSSDQASLSLDQWMSCNTCHWEGEHDARTWLFPFAGPRNTTSLLGMIQTYPLRWSAEWDESADSEFAITQEQFGEGFLGASMHETLGEPNAGRSYDLDCLAAFIDSLAYRSNPPEDESNSELIEIGEEIFFDPLVNCGECHPEPYYTDFKTHDVGTVVDVRERLGPEIDTPTLRSLHRSAPYLHDGSASTLMDILTVKNSGDKHGITSHLSEIELQALEAFLLALP